MKKLFVIGAVLAVVGVSSCRTYCPAYSKADVQKTEKAVQASAVSEKVQG